jgi:hypothetical protein
MGGFPALFAHKSSDLSAIERVIATVTNEIAVDQNFASMTLDYNANNTINYIDIVKSIDGSNKTVRISFTYNAENLITGITKALQ